MSLLRHLIASMTKRTAIIIGAGPAGLTAAYELLERTNIQPIVVEADDIVGGIARTVEHKGNRIDLGGHRFFSKSDRVMNWWQAILPLQRASSSELTVEVAYQNKRRWIDLPLDGPDPSTDDDVMLIRSRDSKILFRGQMFDYPLGLSLGTLRKLGWTATRRIFASYLKAQVSQRQPEESLEDFFINRFGRELYLTFFKSYTEKVWGVECSDIPAEWGAQRIKGLSLGAVLSHAISRARSMTQSVTQKNTETSLIEQFLYPKFGPGQMWQLVAQKIIAARGEIRLNTRAIALEHEQGEVRSVSVRQSDGSVEKIVSDFVFSTMPVCDLISGFKPVAPAGICNIADGLVYRDFITVGLLLSKVTVEGGTTGNSLAQVLPSNWIYVQEPHVQVGRLQIFNNWSPYMVADPDTIWIGLEYFCNEGDALWVKTDTAIAELAAEELREIGLAVPEDVLTSVVIRMPKTYPAYFGTYEMFGQIRDYVDGFKNLFLIGRNGMHRYNNQDHSMLTAMVAVDNIASGSLSKESVWAVNTEADFHEERPRA
jgi:protoporphyrinogen oxidase